MLISCFKNFSNMHYFSVTYLSSPARKYLVYQHSNEIQNMWYSILYAEIFRKAINGSKQTLHTHTFDHNRPDQIIISDNGKNTMRKMFLLSIDKSIVPSILSFSYCLSLFLCHVCLYVCYFSCVELIVCTKYRLLSHCLRRTNCLDVFCIIRLWYPMISF